MSTASLMNGIIQKSQDRTHWVPYYTTFVSVTGLFVALFAMMHYKGSWETFLLFAAVAVIAQLTEVQSFTASRTSISLINVATAAAIVTLGFAGAVLISLIGGLTTIVTTSTWFGQFKHSGSRANWWRRVTFNTSMRTLGAAGGALVFQWLYGYETSVVGLWIIVPLILSVTVDEIIQTVLITVVVHLQTGRKLQTMWQQDRLWSYPITIASGVIGGGGIAFAYETTGIVGLGIFMLPIAATGYALHLYVSHTRSYVDRLEDANGQLEQANLGLLQTLAAVVDAYDIYTFGHSAQVARYAEAIAGAMGLTKQEQTRILRGGLIHDIGKVGVTDAIIGKRGRLTDEEYEALKLHTVIGAEIVSQMPQFQDLVPLVRHHHERWDGRGYPDGLVGEENSLGARIMCVADSVEAMLSDRPYQSTRSLADVIAEVRRCSGSQFDPKVVEAFLTVTEERGEGFFVNSASAVARKLEEKGALETLDGRCYVKKSMISMHLKAANANF